MTTSVGEDLPVQQARVRKIQERAKNLGAAGQFLVFMCEQALRRAEQAAVSGDIVEIVRSYNELKEFQE